MDIKQIRQQYFSDQHRIVPPKKEVEEFIHKISTYFYPVLSDKESLDDEIELDAVLESFKRILKSFNSEQSDLNETLYQFQESLPILFEMTIKDAVAIFEGDPAAKSLQEVIISYPGFYAIMLYRIAHKLDSLNIPILPRMITEYSHSVTGIDIHPKATIGESFCIDHGTGIVIGESTIIGKNVKVYQGVTLGALSVSKELCGKKRHPNIEDNTIIYAGSTILGGNTVVGHDSIIGGNVWLTHSVQPHSIVLNQNKVLLKSSKEAMKEVIDFVI